MANEFLVEGEKITLAEPSRLELFFSVGISYKKQNKLIQKINQVLAGKSGANEAYKHSAIKKEITILEKNTQDEVGGFCEDDGKTIVINKNMPEGEKFWVVTHELEHIKKEDPQNALKLGRFSEFIARLTFNETRMELATKRRVKQFLKGGLKNDSRRS